MRCETVKEKALAALPLLFVCQEENGHLKVTTPYLYPDGDDDAADIWKPEWFEQLSEFSEVVVWSERDKLPKLLRMTLDTV